MAHAYVTLEVFSGDALTYVWTVQAHEQGRYVFSVVKPGEDMVSYVLWPDQNGVGECWSGAQAGMPDVSFMTVARTNPAQSMIGDLDADLGNIAAVVVGAEDAGIPSLGFAMLFNELEVKGGEVQTQDIELRCL